MSLHRLSQQEMAGYKDRTRRISAVNTLNNLLAVLEIDQGVYLEVGAHNGVSASPTRHLLDKNWSAIFIEGDTKLFNECKANTSKYKNVKLINQFIGLENSNRLDQIIEENNTFGKIDVIVIDIDSYDYWIFSDLNYRPAILVIEMNPYIHGDLTIPYGASVDREKTFWGASDYALFRLAIHKGYKCVGRTNCKGWNLFFVPNELFESFNMSEFPIEKVDKEDFILTHPGFIREPHISEIQRKA